MHNRQTDKRHNFYSRVFLCDMLYVFQLMQVGEAEKKIRNSVTAIFTQWFLPRVWELC